MDQKKAYDTITSSITNRYGKLFFLHAPGGTGKTFLINLILAKVRTGGNIALAVVSSGIAATLLAGRKTTHAIFKLPLKVCADDISVCNVSKQSSTAKLLKNCSFIVTDEATMSHKTSVEGTQDDE
ncbi:uncharacterized protein LOC129956729 [Argiope bruennichi]|uniref:uncharacterized protein LOC129956729 n=1 Tax=Argiope bruennichi TaxID=94029 RepID=UPI002494142A|nr:uncharacterized protein LOC129956729 [Argiope bruennichi]